MKKIVFIILSLLTLIALVLFLRTYLQYSSSDEIYQLPYNDYRSKEVVSTNVYFSTETLNFDEELGSFIKEHIDSDDLLLRQASTLLNSLHNNADFNLSSTEKFDTAEIRTKLSSLSRKWGAFENTRLLKIFKYENKAFVLLQANKNNKVIYPTLPLVMSGKSYTFNINFNKEITGELLLNWLSAVIKDDSYISKLSFFDWLEFKGSQNKYSFKILNDNAQSSEAIANPLKLIFFGKAASNTDSEFEKYMQNFISDVKLKGLKFYYDKTMSFKENLDFSSVPKEYLDKYLKLILESKVYFIVYGENFSVIYYSFNGKKFVPGQDLVFILKKNKNGIDILPLDRFSLWSTIFIQSRLSSFIADKKLKRFELD